jgi:starvation-inducible DNA-binding protein
MTVNKPELVNILATLLSDYVVIKYVFHGAHWNVVGQDFSQYHEMFATFYEDAEEAIDIIGEDIRKLGSPTPASLSDFLRLTTIPEVPSGASVQELLKSCYEANELILSDINDAFAQANSDNEQGIADDLAARDSAHKKFRWMMKASLDPKYGY